MPRKNKQQNQPDSAVVGFYPRKEGSEYEQGRKEAIEEVEEKRIIGRKEVVEEKLREDEVINAHSHTPYFEYDNPSYEDKQTFKTGSPKDKKKPKPNKK